MNTMGYIEYIRLIEDGDTAPESWRSAAKGNPNTPQGALALAIQESDPRKVAALIFALLPSALDKLYPQPFPAGTRLRAIRETRIQRTTDGDYEDCPTGAEVTALVMLPAASYDQIYVANDYDDRFWVSAEDFEVASAAKLMSESFPPGTRLRSKSSAHAIRQMADGEEAGYWEAGRFCTMLDQPSPGISAYPSRILVADGKAHFWVSAEDFEALPAVGLGATVHSGGDRRAYTVIAVSKSGRKVTLRRDKATRTDSKGMSESQSWWYEPNPEGETRIAYRQQDGSYRVENHLVTFGKRDEYYDFPF